MEAAVEAGSDDLESICGPLCCYTQGVTGSIRSVSVGLSECVGIERVSVWVYAPEERDYIPVHWWPESKLPTVGGAIAQRFPYLHRELLAGRTVTAASFDELPSGSAADVAEFGPRALFPC